MLSGEQERSLGGRNCMRKVLSGVPKHLMRFLGTCQPLCTIFTFSMVWFCLEAAVNHQYPGVTGKDLGDLGLPRLSTD